jgi:hypothetical protein
MSGISSEIQSVAGALQIEVARADAAVANPKQSPRRIIITVTRARTRRRIAPKPHPSMDTVRSLRRGRPRLVRGGTWGCQIRENPEANPASPSTVVFLERLPCELRSIYVLVGVACHVEFSSRWGRHVL